MIRLDSRYDHATLLLLNNAQVLVLSDRWTMGDPSFCQGAYAESIRLCRAVAWQTSSLLPLPLPLPLAPFSFRVSFSSSVRPSFHLPPMNWWSPLKRIHRKLLMCVGHDRFFELKLVIFYFSRSCSKYYILEQVVFLRICLWNIVCMGVCIYLSLYVCMLSVYICKCVYVFDVVHSSLACLVNYERDRFDLWGPRDRWDVLRKMVGWRVLVDALGDRIDCWHRA